MNECILMMHNAFMEKVSAITLRVPGHIKEALSERAAKSHRSLSAEALHVIESGLLVENGPAAGRFVGMFAGSRVPSDNEILAVRSELWAPLRGMRP